MAYNIQTEDVRRNYLVAMHMIAEANGYMKPDPKNPGNMMPDISKIDRTMLTQGYLCSMADLTPNSQTVQFSIVDTQTVSGSPNLPITRLLAMQDSFFVTSMAYYLFPYTYGANQQNPNFTDLSCQKPLTYPSLTPDQTEQSGVGLQFMDQGCFLFWSPGAYISIEVDKKVIIPYWDCLKHMIIPRTQAPAAPSPLLGTPNNYPLAYDQYDGSTDGYYPVEPTVVFGGGRQNIVKLNLPSTIPSTIAPFNGSSYNATSNGIIMKAMLMFHGILAQNSTSVR